MRPHGRGRPRENDHLERRASAGARPCCWQARPGANFITSLARSAGQRDFKLAEQVSPIVVRDDIRASAAAVGQLRRRPRRREAASAWAGGGETRAKTGAFPLTGKASEEVPLREGARARCAAPLATFATCRPAGGRTLPSARRAASRAAQLRASEPGGRRPAHLYIVPVGVSGRAHASATIRELAAPCRRLENGALVPTGARPLSRRRPQDIRLRRPTSCFLTLGACTAGVGGGARNGRARAHLSMRGRTPPPPPPD